MKYIHRHTHTQKSIDILLQRQTKEIFFFNEVIVSTQSCLAFNKQKFDRKKDKTKTNNTTTYCNLTIIL